MDTRDGRIHRLTELDSMGFTPDDKPYINPMKYHPTPEQRARRKVGRNDVCPCGSGKKFKKCCLFRI